MPDETLLTIDQEPFRIGQRLAFNILCERVRQKERTTGIVLPTGYGKSDVMRLAGLRLQAEGQICQTLILTPSAGLSGQMLEIEELTKMTERYSLPYGRWQRDLFNVHVVKSGDDFINSSTLRGAALVSMTVQMAHTRLPTLVDYINRETRRANDSSPLVVLDEAHMASQENEWGGVVKSVLTDTQAHVALFTATPERTDRDKIAGFDYERRSVQPVEVRKVRAEQDKPIYVDLYEGERHLYYLKADHETTFRDAWLEIPPALCKVQRIGFNPQLKWTEELEGESTLKGSPYLADVPQKLVSRALAQTLRRPEVIAEGCELLVKALRTRQKVAPETAAIVFVGNDDLRLQERTNEHALQVQETLRQIDPRLTSVIATSADLPAAEKTLEDFRIRGLGDVLIVKQMAAVGMDCHRLKVCLDLSNMRASTPFIQRLTRIARVWDRTGNPADLVTAADFIAPDDRKVQALFTHWVSAQGGEATIDDLQHVGTEPTSSSPRPQDSFEYVGMGLGSKLEDTDENEAPGEKLPLGQEVMARLPALTNHYSMPFVLNVFEELGLEQSGNGVKKNNGGPKEEPSAPSKSSQRPEGLFRNPQEEQDSVARRVDEKAKKVALRNIGGKYDKGRYQDAIRVVRTDLREALGIPWEPKLRDLEVGQLRKIEAYLDEILAKGGPW